MMRTPPHHLRTPPPRRHPFSSLFYRPLSLSEHGNISSFPEKGSVDWLSFGLIDRQKRYAKSSTVALIYPPKKTHDQWTQNTLESAKEPRRTEWNRFLTNAWAKHRHTHVYEIHFTETTTTVLASQCPFSHSHLDVWASQITDDLSRQYEGKHFQHKMRLCTRKCTDPSGCSVFINYGPGRLSICYMGRGRRSCHVLPGVMKASVGENVVFFGDKISV